jgi:hypothetical protein
VRAFLCTWLSGVCARLCLRFNGFLNADVRALLFTFLADARALFYKLLANARALLFTF